MNDLEMMLQRQVPRMNEAASSAKPGDGAATDLFSAVLKGENRRDAKDRDRVEPDDETEVEPDPEIAGPEIKAETGPGRSDEMLALLAALMSSAAYDDEAEAGAGLDQDAELTAPEHAGPLDADAEVDLTMSDGPASMKSPIDVQGVEAGAAAAPARSIMTGRVTPMEQPGKRQQQEPAEPAKSAKADSLAPAVKADNPATSAKADNPKPAARAEDPAAVAKAEDLPAPAQARGLAQGPAQGPVAAAQSAEVIAAPAAALSALAGATAKTGRTGQGSQAPDKPQSPQVATSGQIGTVESREVLRTLGLTDEATMTGTGSGKPAVGEEASGAGKKRAAAERPDAEKSRSGSGNVEVVDSRRFLPPAQLSGNAQLITRSLAEASDTALAAQRAAPAQSAAAAAQPQTGQMLHTLKLQLNPASLGNVTAVLKLSGEDLSVAIQVETAEAYRQLNDDNQSILKALRSQGYGVEQITIQHVASSDRSAGQTPQQGFQGTNPGGASADAQSSSGRENGGNGASQQRTNQHGGQGREQSQYPGSGSGRSDGVYL